jgi:hypothetical protein
VPVLIGLVHVSLYFQRRIYGGGGLAPAAESAGLQESCATTRRVRSFSERKQT